MPTITQTSIQPAATPPTNLLIPDPQISVSGTTFDPCDECSWFFGFMSRADAADLLSGQNEVGAFLVRESTTAKGDLVLSVKENNDKISHYIINRLVPEKGNQIRFKIGDHIFTDIPALLTFYKSNNLDDTPLTCTAVPKTRCLSQTRRSFTRDYLAEAQSDLTLTKSLISAEPSLSEPKASLTLQRKLPGKAMVIQSRVPNAYDKTALALKEGQIVNVTKVDISGCWEGEIDGRIGHFPFNYVKFIEDCSDIPRRAAQQGTATTK